MLQLIEEKTGNALDFEGPIRIRMQSPLFSDNTEVTFSFPLKLPYNTENKRKLGFLNLPEIKENSFIPKKYIVLTSAFALYGVIYFKGVPDKYYELFFVGAGNFADESKKLNLRDMDFEDLKVAYLPTYNTNFMDNFPYSESQEEVGAFYNNKINDIQPYTDVSNLIDISLEEEPKVPYLNFEHVFNATFKNLGFNLTRSPFNLYPELKSLYLVNNNSNVNYTITEIASQPDLSCTITIEESKFKVTVTYYIPHADGDFFKIKNLSNDIGLNNKIYRIENIDDFNFYLDGLDPDDYPQFSSISGFVHKMTLARSLGEVKGNNHVPNKSAHDFLNEIENLLCGKGIPSESSKKAKFLLWKNIINNPITEDITKYSSEPQIDTLNEYDGYTLSFSSPGNDSYWGNAQKEITDNLTLKDAVATSANLPLSGSENNDVRYVTAERAYYRFRKFAFQSGEGWEFYSWDFHNKTEGNGDLQISCGLAPMLPYIFKNRIWIRADRTGGFISLNDTNYEDMRLAFYRGVFSDASNYNITAHLSTPDVYDHEGNKIANANLALKWDGPYGLYENFYKDYIDWILNIRKDFTSTIIWPAKMLHDFPWERKFKIKSSNFLIKSIDFILYQDIIEFGETGLAVV